MARLNAKGGTIPLRLRSFLTQQRRFRDVPPFGGAEVD
jgi:hypothetical protein